MHPARSEGGSPRGLGLLVILGVVLPALAVLGTVVWLTMVRSVKTPSLQLRLGSHMKQISVGLHIYALEQGRLPVPLSRGTQVAPEEWRDVTVRTLGVMVHNSGGDMTARAIWDRSDRSTAPGAEPGADGAGWTGAAVPIALDWSLADMERGSMTRALLGRREPLRTSARTIVVFADTHYDILPMLPGTAETPPVEDTDPTLPWSVPYDGDDLFTSAGDGPGMNVVGKGSATRCFLK
ncbi:MAG: hypothetical protein RLZZ127_1978 [Planctomycetota bacterium]|jgi:hypothetical protein